MAATEVNITAVVECVILVPPVIYKNKAACTEYKINSNYIVL